MSRPNVAALNRSNSRDMKMPPRVEAYIPRYVPTLSHPYFRHSIFSFSFDDLGGCESPSFANRDSAALETSSFLTAVAVCSGTAAEGEVGAVDKRRTECEADRVE